MADGSDDNEEVARGHVSRLLLVHMFRFDVLLGRHHYLVLVNILQSFYHHDAFVQWCLVFPVDHLLWFFEVELFCLLCLNEV